jgi:hypothetical protein
MIREKASSPTVHRQLTRSNSASMSRWNPACSLYTEISNMTVPTKGQFATLTQGRSKDSLGELLRYSLLSY